MRLNPFEGRKIRTRYIHPGLEVGPSKIVGRGVIATVPIAAGEVLMRWGGVEVPKSEYRDEDFHAQSTTLLDDNTYLARPLSDQVEPIDDYLNHSCDPNAWMTDEVTVVARRDIKTGDEITVDAVMWDADEEWPYLDEGETCNCGSPLCRKTLSATDYLRPELQKRYRGHFSPYIEQKIRDSKSQN